MSLTVRLVNLNAHDPVSFASVAGLLVLAAMLACYPPARCDDEGGSRGGLAARVAHNAFGAATKYKSSVLGSTETT